MRILSIVDESTGECHKIHVARQIRATDIIGQFAELFVTRGAPDIAACDEVHEQILKMAERLSDGNILQSPKNFE